MNDMMQTGFDYAALPVSLQKADIEYLEHCAFDVELGAKITSEGVLRMGKALNKAKERFGENDKAFGQWKKGRFPWLSPEKALVCQNADQRFGAENLLHNNYGVEKLSPTVLYLLAAPSTPDAVIEKAIEKSETGAKVTVADVKDWKAELDAATQRCEEFRQESNERRKKIRDLEEQIDLLTIRDRMMQGRLEKADEAIKYLGAVVPEPEKVVVAPDDYERLKQTERDLRSDLAELKQQQREMVQQQVVAKLKERESELAEIDRKVQHAETLLSGLQTQIDRYSMQQRELKVHLDTIENARVAMAVLAANLEGFGEVIDRDHELRQWRALADMLRNGAAAIEHFIGNTKPALSVIRGEAA